MAKAKMPFPDTPMCKKLSAYREEQLTLCEFFEWLGIERPGKPRLTLCDAEHNGVYYPCAITLTRLLNLYFGIDEKQLETERRALLDYQRRLNAADDSTEK